MWDYFACERFKDFVREIVEGNRRPKSAGNGRVADVYLTATEAERGEMVVDDDEGDVATASEAEPRNEEFSDVEEDQFGSFQLPLGA